MLISFPTFSNNRLGKRKGGGGHSSSSSSHSSSSSSHTSSSSKGGDEEGGSSSGGSTTSKSSTSSKSIPLSNTGRTSSSSSLGGGSPFVIASGTTFAGRQAGGGTRSLVYGSYYYGSGYPYGGYGWFVYQRPLPYVFWPVYIYPSGLYGSVEYGPASNSSRPGGTQVAVTFQLSSNATQVYRVMGDNSSVSTVLDSLASNCGATAGVVYSFDPDSTNSSLTLPRPEQVIQYYRASSFALSLDSYNNSAALASNAPTSNSTAPSNFQQTPLPGGLNTTFLTCVNTTIGDTLPLMNPSESKKLSSTAIGGIVAASFVGLFILVALIIHCCGGRSYKVKSFSSKSGKLSFRMPWKRNQPYASLKDGEEDAFHYDETKL